jgi:hypothetical protein
VEVAVCAPNSHILRADVLGAVEMESSSQRL